MRKIPPGNYNIICKGKSGELIQSSPNPEREENGIFHIMANYPGGLATDGSYIYFNTAASFSQLNSISVAEYQLYKYSIVGGERIWVFRYPNSYPEYERHTGEGIFILGNYLYVKERRKVGGTWYEGYQRRSKVDGSRYGDIISPPTIEWFPPTPHPSYPPHRAWRGLYSTFNWGSNCFVDGSNIYIYRVYNRYYYDGGYDAPCGVFIAKLDSNLDQVGLANVEPPSGTEWDIYGDIPNYFILGWNGSQLCGGGRWEYDGGDWGKGAFATWNPSGGPPTNTWICVNPYGQEMTPVSGCSGNNVIIGNEIWSFGEMHDGERVYNPDNGRYYLTINPEKNAMYYNANWRLTCIHWPYLHSTTPGNYDFYNYGSFYRGHYPEIDRSPLQSLFHGGKFYYTIYRGPAGINEMTSGGVYQNIHIV